MTAAALRKGWCPSLLQPMESGDGWLVRIKPHAATLRAEPLRALAEAASRYGNGQIDLTARANLQVRGLSPESAEAFAEVALAHGFAASDPGIEQIRTVMASPLGADDPSAAFDSHAVAGAIEDMLACETALHALPAKFGIAVDGGGALPLGGVRGDIVIVADGAGVAVSVDGGEFAHRCEVGCAPEAVRALAHAFLALGKTERSRPRRMADLVARIGADAVFDAAGLNTSPVTQPKASPTPPVGVIGYGQGAAVSAGLPFGQIDARTLGALADLAEVCGDGTVRTTPWRALLLAGIEADQAEALGEALTALGLIVDPHDARLAIHACVGAPACRNASVSTRADGARLAASGATRGLTIHVSGCEKLCAYHGEADVTLVGRDGRYDVLRPAMRQTLTGLTLDEVIAAMTERRP